MAETIKGISVVIGAETTGLDKALADVNKQSRNLQGELKQVEKLLKMDPSNIELASQKQKLLGDAVNNTREKLDRLRAVQEDVARQFAKGDITEGQFRAFQREVASAEQELKRFENRLADTGDKTVSLGDRLRDAGSRLSEIGDKLKGVGQTMSTMVTAPIVGGFAALTVGTREFRGDLAKLSANAQVAGQDMGILNDAMATLSAVTGETDSSVEGLSELLATGFRGEQLTTLLESLYGASIKFADTLKFEGISDGLQETLATGAAVGPFAELLERSGVALKDFNTGLTEAIANGTEEQYVLDVLAKTGLADSYEAWRKQNEAMVEAQEANFRMQQAFAKLGATLEPILTPIIAKVTELVGKFTELDPATQKVIIAIAGIAAAVGPLLMILGSMASGFSVVSGAVTKFVPMLAKLVFGLGPVGIAIAAAVAAGVLLYKNWDTIKAKAQELWAKIKAVWDGIKTIVTSKVSDLVEAGKNIVQGLWDGISSMGATLSANVAAFINKHIPQVVRRILGISSPSKVMARFGKYVAEGLAAGIDEGSGRVSQAAQKMTQAITGAAQAMTNDLSGALSLTIAQFDLEVAALSDEATETEKMTIQLKKLSAEKEAAAKKVEILAVAYETAKQKLGENNEATKQYAQDLQMSQIELQKVDIEIKKTNISIDKQAYVAKKAAAAQVKALQDIADEITAVEKKYRDDLAAAADDYRDKVRRVNDQLIADEQRVTDEYNRELDNRAKSLYNFVGLFDEVRTSDITGEELLNNLAGQVDTFSSWQDDLAELSARGLNEGLIEELRAMGPDAAAEIAALTTLSDKQLTQYTDLWQQKSQMARDEAVAQLQQQREEMYQKLQEIRQDAADQLERYRIEWKNKNEEILKNTKEKLAEIETRFKGMAVASTDYGQQLIKNYVAGMESQFDRLRQAVEEAQSIVGDLDPSVRHSPSLIDRVKSGVGVIAGLYENLQNSLKSIDFGSMISPSVPAVAGATTSSSTINNMQIYIQGGSTGDMADQLLRELQRRGVKF